MQQIGIAAGKSLVSAPSQQELSVRSQRALWTRQRSSMPAPLVRKTDIELPSRLWDPWREAGKPRRLRRELTEGERNELEARRDTLAPWICGFHPEESLEVINALGSMFDAFPMMLNVSEERAAGKIAAMQNAIAPYPKWAIERACARVRLRGYTKRTDGAEVIERHWPPTESELISVIEQELQSYKLSHDTAVALLTAEVAS
jgi:hypothetical protein